MKAVILAVALLASASLYADGEVPAEFQPYVGTYENIGGPCKITGALKVSYARQEPLNGEDYVRGPNIITIKMEGLRPAILTEIDTHGEGRFAFGRFTFTENSLKHEFSSNAMGETITLIISKDDPTLYTLISKSGSYHRQLPECHNVLRKTK